MSGRPAHALSISMRYLYVYLRNCVCYYIFLYRFVYLCKHCVSRACLLPPLFVLVVLYHYMYLNLELHIFIYI